MGDAHGRAMGFSFTNVGELTKALREETLGQPVDQAIRNIVDSTDWGELYEKDPDGCRDLIYSGLRYRTEHPNDTGLN